MYLINYRGNPVEALRALESMSAGNQRLQRVWRKNIERVRSRKA